MTRRHEALWLTIPLSIISCTGSAFENCEWHREKRPPDPYYMTQPTGMEKGWWSVDARGATGAYFVEICSEGRDEAVEAAAALARRRGVIVVKFHTPTEVLMDPTCKEGEVSGECW